MLRGTNRLRPLAVLPCLLALLPALSSAPAEAAGTALCDTYCDARDPQYATGDRVPVSTTVHSRTIGLHLSDNDVMGWASIDDGAAGDEVWLDRSFDGGASWASGSKLGDTRTPSGRSGWRSQMYNVDDWNNAGVGAATAPPTATRSRAPTPGARHPERAAGRPPLQRVPAPAGGHRPRQGPQRAGPVRTALGRAALRHRERLPAQRPRPAQRGVTGLRTAPLAGDAAWFARGAPGAGSHAESGRDRSSTAASQSG
ncbi:hypothetical protein [Streptomyces sp. NBC_01435]|uniref:hypothetical protein n=1 Tax=Streptomyces sp. NBC_01435 TaxID=2903865 RepID=UPI003FCCB880